MYQSHQLGKDGEKEAEEYLLKKGYKILDRNFFCRRGEIDIVAIDKLEIVFIEVKTRTGNKYGLPSESVTENKIKKILKTAEFYLYIKRLENKYIRIDVIEVYANREKNRINHIKQVI